MLVAIIFDGLKKITIQQRLNLEIILLEESVWGSYFCHFMIWWLLIWQNLLIHQFRKINLCQ